MTSQHDKAKRWRLKFSVRTLAIILTLTCCYAACWGPTKRIGVRDVLARQYVASGLSESDIGKAVPFFVAEAEPLAPLLVSSIHTDLEADEYEPRKHFYFWFFGHIVKLPFDAEAPL